VNIASPTTTQPDADTLVAVRIAAMRESLERIGRFDPQRALERFLAPFDPALCRLLELDGVQSGLILFRPQEDHWLLDHLYILPGAPRERNRRSRLARCLRERRRATHAELPRFFARQ